jgi:hypothetical protein
MWESLRKVYIDLERINKKKLKKVWMRKDLAH